MRTTLIFLLSPVALRKESVDRNALSLLIYHLKYGSLSARRAWIEIDIDGKLDADLWVSLSARRAWIEIGVLSRAFCYFFSRSPQGERG